MIRKLIISYALAVSLWPLVSLANPQGGTVVSGDIKIIQETPSKIVIQQKTHKGSINWDQFGIEANEHVHFDQPSSSAITHNRVIGRSASEILGRITATGNVWLVNGNGVHFGKGAVIDVNGIVASTHDITNQNFKNGIYKFDQPGNPNATILNEGTITIREGGIAVLVAPGVRNSGAIFARLGKVGIGAANKFTLDLYGDDLIVFESDATVLDKIMGPDGKPLKDAIRNDGKIEAEGGIVIITADIAKGIVDNVINMDGIVSAQSVEQRQGKIVLKGGNEGVVHIAGLLDVSGKGEGEKGGDVSILGAEIILEDASINASGGTGGGAITVGNWETQNLNVDADSRLAASAMKNGGGGSVDAIAQKTAFAGSIQATGGMEGGDGGNAETSGNRLKIGGARIDLSASQGLSGTCLIDPYDLNVDTSAATSISNALGSANVTLLTTANSASGFGTADAYGNGDINVNAGISWASDNSLTLNAYRNVNVYADITASGASPSFILDPGQGTTGRLAIYSESSIALTGTGPNLMIDGNAYTLVSSANELQSVNSSGNYALKNDIDLKSISNFTPIGSSSNFTGNFDGLGHKLSNLTVNLPDTDYAGLFGTISNNSNIRNLNLVSGSITGRNYVGGIVGQQRYGYLYNVYAAASVTSNGAAAGGLVGYLYAGSINQSYSSGNVSGDGAGGLVGIHDGSINESSASGNISGDLSIGGLVGSALTGHRISNSYATGRVNGNTNVGGLVGRSRGSTAQNSSTRNAYLSGLISGTTDVGGLVGYCCGFYNYSYSSFWNTETSGQLASSRGTGLTDAQMKQQSSFSNWDFTNIWEMSFNGYPKLRNAPSISSSSSDTNSTNSPANDNAQNVADQTSQNDGIINDIEGGEEPPLVPEPEIANDGPSQSFPTPEELANNILLFGDNGRNLNDDPAWNSYPLEMRKRAYEIVQQRHASATTESAKLAIASPTEPSIEEEDVGLNPRDKGFIGPLREDGSFFSSEKEKELPDASLSLPQGTFETANTAADAITQQYYNLIKSRGLSEIPAGYEGDLLILLEGLKADPAFAALPLEEREKIILSVRISVLDRYAKEALNEYKETEAFAQPPAPERQFYPVVGTHLAKDFEMDPIDFEIAVVALHNIGFRIDDIPEAQRAEILKHHSSQFNMFFSTWPPQVKERIENSQRSQFRHLNGEQGVLETTAQIGVSFTISLAEDVIISSATGLAKVWLDAAISENARNGIRNGVKFGKTFISEASISEASFRSLALLVGDSEAEQIRVEMRELSTAISKDATEGVLAVSKFFNDHPRITANIEVVLGLAEVFTAGVATSGKLAIKEVGEKTVEKVAKELAESGVSGTKLIEAGRTHYLTPVVVSKMPTAIEYIPSSGVKIVASKNKTTTIIGRFETDMVKIIDELDYPKTLDFDAKIGGYNVLNAPDSLYVGKNQFWNEFNKPFLDKALERGDDIMLASKPNPGNIFDAKGGLTNFGQEYNYLTSNKVRSMGYTYDPITNMIRK